VKNNDGETRDRRERHAVRPGTLLKALGFGVLAVVCVLVVVLLLLLLPPIRGRVLHEVILQADARLPGAVRVETSSWPALGAIEMSGLSWTDGPDTLVAVDRMGLSVALGSLFRRDLRLQEMTIEATVVDVPAISGRFRGPPSAKPEPSRQAKGRRFPREGSIPGVPSLALDRLSVKIQSARLTDALSFLDLDLLGGVDVSWSGQPVIRVDRLGVRAPDTSWQVSDLSVALNLEDWSVSGRGSGQLAPQWPLLLSIETDGDDRFRLSLTRREGIHPPDAIGLTLVGEVARSGRRISSVEFDALLRTPGTADLRDVPGLASRFEALPALEGVGLSVGGRVGLDPEFSVNLDLSLHPNAWLTGGRGRMRYGKGEFAVDTLWVALPDLLVSARARAGPDSVLAGAEVGIGGIRWLGILSPEAQGPDSLKAHALVTVQGPRQTPDVRATLEASAKAGGFRLDRLLANAHMPGPKERPVELGLEADALEMRLRAAAELDRGTDLILRISPLVISGRTEPRLRAIDTYPKSGLLRYSPEDGLSIEKVGIVGALGEIVANLRFHPERTGNFGLAGSWPGPPDLLVRTINLEPAKWDSLSASWRRSGPFRIDLDGTIEPEGELRRVRSKGSFRLPGPRTVAALLPPGFAVDDLTPVTGRFTLDADQGPGMSRFATGLDMGETAWLDTARVEVRGHGSAIEIDRLALSVEGLEVGLEGGRVDSLWDLRSRIALTGTRLLGRFAPGFRDSLDLALNALASFQGTPTSPNLDAVIEASVRGPSYRLPRMEGRARWTDAGLELNLDCPGGVTTGPVHLDTLYASYRSRPEGSPFHAGRLIFNAQGPEIGLRQELALETEAGLKVNAESLSLRVREHSVRSSHPFRLEILPEGAGLRVSDLDLSGSLGRIQVDGITGPDSSDIAAFIALRLPPAPPLPSIPRDLWPEEVNLEVRAEGPNEIRSTARISGLTLGDREEISTRVEVAGRSQAVTVEMAVLDARGPLLEGHVQLPISVTLYPPGGHLEDRPVSAEIVLSRFPVPTELDGVRPVPVSRQTAGLDGKISVRGTTRHPVAYVDTRLSFPGWPKMSGYSLGIETLAWPRLENGVSVQQTLKKGSMLVSEGVVGGESGGVAAAFSLRRREQILLKGGVFYPVVWSLSPGDSIRILDEPLRAHLASEDLPLSEFDALLPPNVGLDGRLRIRLQASGALEDPGLEGEVVLSKLRVSAADGTRVVSDGRISIGGRANYPSVRGNVEIINGVIRVPDPPKNLHPSDGSALLWDVQPSPQGTEAATAPPAGRKPGSAPEMDLDMTLLIPSGLWIRGQGLDVELAGELQVVQQGAYPTVTGNLNAVRGRLDLLGRVFRVDRGQVVFYGDDEVNPALDLQLSAQVEGSLIRVSVGGTVQKPELALTSEPEMTEGDIMSILLFGRPLDELNTDQANLVQRRAGDIAAAFGMSKLEMKIARQLGVDMVSIQPGSGEDPRRALILGKYISRRVLLKYEQALEEWGSFFVNLEYFMTRRVKVETLIGRQSESAIEVNWSTEY
jgi:translocation and assembly module TamB